MSYATIIARLKADIEAVSGIGTVYNRKRLVHDDHTLKKVFERGNDILTDTGFDDSDKWSGDWTITGSTATETATGSNLDLTQENADFNVTLVTGNYDVLLTISANTLDTSTNTGQIRGICTAESFTWPSSGEKIVPITVNSASSDFTVRLTSGASSGTITLSAISLKRTGLMHFWHIYRAGDIDQTDYLTLAVNTDNYIVEGYYGFDDSANSFNTFQGVVDGIVEALNGDRLLNSQGYIVYPVRKPEIDEENIVGVLCHHARLEVPILTPMDLS